MDLCRGDDGLWQRLPPAAKAASNYCGGAAPYHFAAAPTYTVELAAVIADGLSSRSVSQQLADACIAAFPAVLSVRCVHVSVCQTPVSCQRNEGTPRMPAFQLLHCQRLHACFAVLQ